jgi:hypothetical protein
LNHQRRQARLLAPHGGETRDGSISAQLTITPGLILPLSSQISKQPLRESIALHILKLDLFWLEKTNKAIELLVRRRPMTTTNTMTSEEREQVRQETFERAKAIVQKYQNDNWRQLRVNKICSELKMLLEKAASRQF